MDRNKIFKLIKVAKPEFIEGVTQIQSGGRVYDEKEIISLVDSALDFWLTSGKYTHQFEEDFSKFFKLFPKEVRQEVEQSAKSLIRLKE